MWKGSSRLVAATTTLAGCVLVAAPAAAQSKATDISAQGAGVASLGEIVVTASRHAENIQKAALSVQALSSEALSRANVVRPEDLNTVAHGVQIGTGGNYPQVYIRGIGNFAGNAFGESAVAWNLDGVYISQTLTTRGMFYDLERVEVLKGPQGTLYGRNASGGAINVITAKPKFDGMNGFAEVQAGNYGLIQGTAAVNLPLSDTVAIRASGQVVSRNGYLSDGYSDEKTQSGRLQLLWKPRDDFSLLLNGNYQHVGGMGVGSVLTPQLPGDKFRGVADPAVTAIYQAQPLGGQVTVPLVYPKTDGSIDYDIRAVGAELNWNLGFGTLTVLPAYRDTMQHELNYVAAFRSQLAQHDRQTSLEVRLGNSDEKLKWLIGAYYFDQQQQNPNGEPLQTIWQGPSAQSAVQFDLETLSYAAFGQATYSLTDRFRVTGGLRYTHERKQIDELLYTYTARTAAGGCPAGTAVAPTVAPPLDCRRVVPIAGRLPYNKMTWKAGLEYDVAPRSMAYANVSTGFKSGGFYQAPPPNTFDAEKLTAFDAGVKNRFLDNRLQVNIEAFYWIYKGHQDSTLGTTSIPGYLTLVTLNAGKAKSYGIEFDARFHPTSQDELGLNVQYNGTKYDDFKYDNFGLPITGCIVGPPHADHVTRTVDCSGKPLPRAPLWTISGSYGHNFDLGEYGNLNASADAQYTTSSWLSSDYVAPVRQKAYAMGNFDLTYTPDHGNWVLSAYVHNVSNEAVNTKVIRHQFITAANPLADPNGLYIAITRPPRTFGARLRLSF